jgi:LysM domain-containing protein
LRFGTPPFAIGVFAVGLLTFGIVFTLLTFSPSAAAPDQQVPQPESSPPTPVVAVATDSLAPRIAPDNLAIGVPIAGFEALLRNVQPGDRLDILASLGAPQTGVPVTSVLVRGATVVRSAEASDPLLVQVSASDAIMLAHVVMRGTRIGYVLWPASGSLPAATPAPVDEQTARDLLGISQPTSVPATPMPSAAVPTPPQPTPTPRGGSGFLYQVQPNDTWSSIAATFAIPVDQLRQWNESSGEGDPTPGSLVFIPRAS